MATKKEIRGPIVALVLLSLGGWLLHFKIHPIQISPDDPQNPANYLPFIIGLVNIIAVPFLLGFARTFVIGYLINGMGVIIGTIVMAHLSLTSLPHPLNFANIFLGTTLPDIFILLPKLLIAQNILKHYHPNGMGRMFTPWWWLRHLCYLGAVYAVGHFLWR